MLSASWLALVHTQKAADSMCRVTALDDPLPILLRCEQPETYEEATYFKSQQKVGHMTATRKNGARSHHVKHGQLCHGTTLNEN